jgi:hypothetical protein
MHDAKSLSKPDSGRRSFLRKAGAAISATVAAAVPGMASRTTHQEDGLNAEVDRLSRQLGLLEDQNAIRTLHQTYETLLDGGMYEQVVELFTEDGAVVFNGGVFSGKKDGVSRLYRDRFRAGSAGKKIGPPPGFELPAEQQQETINAGIDRRSASAQFPYSIQVGAPLVSDSSLVILARLHGGGIMKWCESGTCEASYAKDGKDGSWKIKRLEYRASSITDYRPGKSYARPISVPTFSKTYPEDPAGPDRLI